MRTILVGKTHEEQLQAADNVLRKLQAKVDARDHMPTGISPFILSGYIDTGTMLAYIPIECVIDLVDIYIDSIEAAPDEKKPEAIMTIEIMPVTGLSTSLNLKVKAGHSNANPQYTVSSPVKFSLKFNKRVSAWVCIVAYPVRTRQLIPVQAEVVADEGILLPNI
jgi:hypothetical protein